MIYLLTIKTGFVGIEECYLCHESDELYDIGSIDEIVDNLAGYIGCYPTVEELMEELEISEEDAYEEQQQIIQDDISFDKTLATLEDLDNVSIFPHSILIEGSEEIINYRNYLERDKKMDDLLS